MGAKNSDLAFLFFFFCWFCFWIEIWEIWGKRTEPNQPLTRCAHPCPPGDEAVDVLLSSSFSQYAYERSKRARSQTYPKQTKTNIAVVYL